MQNLKKNRSRTNRGPAPKGPAAALAKDGALMFAVGIKGAIKQELLVVI